MLRAEIRSIKLGKDITLRLKRELRQQGHYLTGQTAKSLDMDFVKLPEGYALRLEETSAIKALNEGAIFGGKKPPYDVILEWVRKRGIPRTASGRTTRSKSIDYLQRQAAFRVQAAIGEKGLPTKGGYAYSKNGERKGFIGRAASESYIEEQLNLRGLVEELVEINFGA